MQDTVHIELPDVLGTMDRWVCGVEPVWAYQKILDMWGDDFTMYWKHIGLNNDFARAGALFGVRQDFIKKYGFAIPCAELLDTLAESKLVVEVGAGSGYMTALMRTRDINVVGSNPLVKFQYSFAVGRYDVFQVAAQAKTMVRRYPEATIFCSWPSLDETWFRQMLRAMRPKQRLVTILEECCAEETAREYLDSNFTLEKTIDIPAFPSLNDLVYVYRKVRTGKSKT